MKTSIASVLAVLFAAQAAHAQDAEPSPNPVEEQEVDASQGEGPAEGSGVAVSAAPATANPVAASEEEKWDVLAPRGATIRQVPLESHWVFFRLPIPPSSVPRKSKDNFFGELVWPSSLCV